MTTIQETKPIHTILLDASPILLNNPPISTLTKTCTILVTTPAVIAEIKAEEARSRFETLYKPFVEIRTPKPESVKFVKDFARKTGDLAVLSTTDLEILALAYDLEIERNGGDWRLRNAPGQKRVNGSPPVKEQPEQTEAAVETEAKSEETEAKPEEPVVNELTSNLEQTTIDPQPLETEEVPELDEDSASSDSGWITPSNIKRKKQQSGQASTKALQKTIQIATITNDFAMQNVLLQINLNLLSPSCTRISNIKQTIFRCHACFQTCKDMSKQFCPKCGKPSLTRVTCTTNDRGEVKLHLKQSMQWNNRGNVFSVPKPVPGTANMKWKGPQNGGGQGGWGSDLILAEDQKEYVRARDEQKRERGRDLMDQDILPSILTGERKGGRKIQIGAGRTVNSKKR